MIRGRLFFQDIKTKTDKHFKSGEHINPITVKEFRPQNTF